MGYDLHIIRSKNTWDSRNNPISVEDWLQIVETDPELKAIDKLVGKNPITGREIIISMPNSAEWEHCEDKCKVPFHYLNGGISVSNPDEVVIKKMKEIAIRLNAYVIGDEQEEY